MLVLGVGAKWLSWRLKAPSILVLLFAGFGAGAVGLVDPDLLFGDLLMPFVSISVALILFEGGMSLRREELSGGVWKPLRNLISIGVAVCWLVLTCAGTWLLQLDWLLSALLAAILVVSGPTVIGPMLNQIRPVRSVNSILKWEGIIIDPIGVMLAVLMFSVIAGEVPGNKPLMAVVVVLKTLVVGGAIGAVGALFLATLLRRYVVPDYLQNPVTLMFVLLVFALANEVQEEAGLLAVTVMGIGMANQTSVSIRHIVEFKENLRVLIISSLFILLAARVSFDDLAAISAGGVGYVVVVMFVARPLAVFASTIGSDLGWRERVFLCWVAPRGIVAAAVSSILAGELIMHGHPEAEILVSVTFVVIFVTVVFCGLTAGPAARWLGVAQRDPQGFLILGAHGWGRAVARELQALDCPVIVVDSNRENVREAQAEGLPTYWGDILTEHSHDELDLSGIGRLLALTPNEEVNTLACLHFTEEFGRAGVFQLVTDRAEEGNGLACANNEFGGRRLFASHATYDLLERRAALGGTVTTTPITAGFVFEDYIKQHGESAVPLFSVGENGRVDVFTTQRTPGIAAGKRVVSQVLETTDRGSAPRRRATDHVVQPVAE